jgi:S-DNA-T family DNA segregation ATPase FtsK/SpoIIIE
VSHIVVKRPPRSLPSAVPTGEIAVQPPPELPRGNQESVLMQLLPTLGMGGSVVFFFTSGQPFMRIMGMIMIASTIAMSIAMVVRFRRGSQGQLADMRRDYLGYLAQTRRTAMDAARAQRDAQYYLHPSPEQLWALVAEGSRVWERRPGDEDFAQVRIGLGAQGLATPLIAPETGPVQQLEPLTAGALQRFLAVHGTVDDLPMAVSLRAFYHVTISGEPQSVRSSARALAGSLAALHSPEDLIIVVAAGREELAHWEWAKWLPHVQSPEALDGAGSRRLIGSDPRELENLIASRLTGRPRFHPNAAPLPEEPHIVVVLDSLSLPPDSHLANPEGLQGVTTSRSSPAS